MTTFAYIIAAISAYLLGSIPFGYLAGISRGVDIRTVGSGNIGATNVYRTLGKKLGIATFVLDVFKGVAATSVIPQSVWFMLGFEGTATLYMVIACGALVLIGHSFPLFLNFKGGKGVATGLGVTIGVAPHSAILGLAVWIAVFFATRYVSVGSIIAAAVVGIAVWLLDNSYEPANVVPAVVSLLAVLVILKHRKNIARLINGNENRFDFSKRKKNNAVSKNN